VIIFIVQPVVTELFLQMPVNRIYPGAGMIKVDNSACKKKRKLLYHGTGNFQFRFFGAKEYFKKSHSLFSAIILTSLINR
jgi:hypothetical protein